MERRTERLIVISVMILGLVLRLIQAARCYLNPDELQYFFLALSDNFNELYLSGLRTDHPPLLFLLLHPIASVTSSELALRLIPVLAGTIFPWVVYRWLATLWSAGAGLAALFILTLSPNLIQLSAQVRGYTLELLFAALALLFLDTPMRNRLLAMILFVVSLNAAVLSEYSAAYFAGAVGIYFLLRVRELKASPRIILIWALGQLTALALYGFLYWTLIKPRLAVKRGTIDGFLSGAFPSPHENLLLFSSRGMLKQFAYTFSSVSLGVGAAILFGAVLVILWKGGSPPERTRNRQFATLLVLPFLLACVGALLRLHPYARSRHTVILSLFVVTGVSIALERMFRLLPWTAGFTALFFALVWMMAADHDQNNIAPDRDRRTSMIAAVRYLRSIPPGSFVLANEETNRYLRFYMSGRQDMLRNKDVDNPEGPPIGSLHVTYRSWAFGEVDDFLRDLASVRSTFGLNKGTSIWVLDGGFDTGLDVRLRKAFPGVYLPAYRNFGAMTVFRTPPGI
jgi:4-amino-4-deoxy-L-arabinose transferase-like glycosyltransferase